MIYKTFGPGGDFTDPYHCAVYIASLGTLTDDYTFTQVGDCTMSGIMIDVFQSGSNGHTITYDSNNPHNGSLTAGWKINVPSIMIGGLPKTVSFGARLISSGIYMHKNLRIVDISDAGGIIVHASGYHVDAFAFWENIIVQGNGGGTGIYIQNDNRVRCRVYGCKVHNCTVGIGTPGSGSVAGETTPNKVVENCSVYGGLIGVKLTDDSYTFGGWVIKNVVCAGQGGIGHSAWVVPVTHDYNSITNCADDDGTLPDYATNSQENITVVDEFISLDSSSSDFLKPKTTGVIANGGVAPTYATSDIEGFTIPDVAGWYPIGCHVANEILITSASACESKNDYITISGPGVDGGSIRFGSNKLINLTNFLPQYVKQTDTSAFLYVFETYINEMFDGENGFILSAVDLTINKLYVTTSGISGGVSGTLLDIGARNFNFDMGTSSTSAISTDANNEAKKVSFILPDNYYSLNPKISILEKIKRLTELQDPDLIPIKTNYDFISLLGRNLGYQVDVNRENMQYTGNIDNSAYIEDNTYSAVDVGKYLRFMIANLPNWYKIKTTENAIRVLLYSFGLIGNINNYYTQDYNKYWLLDEGSVHGLDEIPDDYYPSPHYAVLVEIEDNLGSEVSFDEERRNKVVNAINSVRPVNTVFEKLGGHFEINLPSVDININIKIDSHFVIY